MFKDQEQNQRESQKYRNINDPLIWDCGNTHILTLSHKYHFILKHMLNHFRKKIFSSKNHKSFGT